MPAPFGFPSTRAYRQGPISVRRPEASDLAAIERLVRTSSRAYSGLGGAMREALHDDFALSAWQDEALAGFLLAYRQGPQVVWIYALGAAEDVSLERVGRTLLEELERCLVRVGIGWIGYMDEYRLSWLRRLLERSGFRPHTRVVSYEAPLGPPPAWGNRAVRVRPAEADDLSALAQLDQAAFGPLWTYRERVFASVLGQAGCFLLAEQESALLGYILCTLHEDLRAHVVRLAVDPQQQGQQIGTRLLAEAFQQLRGLGVEWISLNTQEENRRSQRLYHRFGFRPTGEAVGVWVKEVKPQP